MANIYGYIDQDSRKILLDSRVVAVKTDVGVDVITFIFESYFNEVSNLTTAAKRVFYTDANGETQNQLLTTITQNAHGQYEVPWTIPSMLLQSPIRVGFAIQLIETGENSSVIKRWNTETAVFKVATTTNDSGLVIDLDDYDRLAAVLEQALSAADSIGSTENVINNITGSAPKFVPTLADRVNPTLTYVVTDNNHLYYYNTEASDWADAGEYGSYQITSEFNMVGQAIESQAVGARFTTVENAVAGKIGTAQGAANANKVFITDPSGNATTEEFSVVLGISGSKFLSDSVYGVTLINSANLVSPPDGTAEMINYIIDRLSNNPDGIVAYSGSTECTMTVDTIEATGSYAVADDAIILDDEVALMDGGTNSVVVCIKTSNYWAIATTDQIETYVTSNPFVIYATIEL